MIGTDIKNFATAGVLKQLSVDDTELVSAINLAMIELHKVFRLTVNEQLILMTELNTLYTLSDDCLHVIEVYNQIGQRYHLNDEYEENSISTISYNQIQVGNPIPGEYLSVIYQASPQLIATLDGTVSIPHTLLEPMLHYIGYVMYGSSSADLDSPASHHIKIFHDSCDRVKREGLITPDNEVENNVNAKGYV